MKRIKRIILAFLILTAILLGAVSQTVSETRCREGIICDDVGCLGGETKCAIIPCNGYPVLCFRP
jgi:hypothetical protein